MCADEDDHQHGVSDKPKKTTGRKPKPCKWCQRDFVKISDHLRTQHWQKGQKDDDFWTWDEVRDEHPGLAWCRIGEQQPPYEGKPYEGKKPVRQRKPEEPVKANNRPREISFLCPHKRCRSCFASYAELVGHMKACKHLGPKPFPCRAQGCSYSSDDQLGLDRHEREDCDFRDRDRVPDKNMREMQARAADKPWPAVTNVRYRCLFLDCTHEAGTTDELEDHMRDPTAHSDGHPKCTGNFRCTFLGCGKIYEPSRNHYKFQDHDEDHRLGTNGLDRPHNSDPHIAFHRYRCLVEGCTSTYYSDAEVQLHRTYAHPRRPPITGSRCPCGEYLECQTSRQRDVHFKSHGQPNAYGRKRPQRRIIQDTLACQHCHRTFSTHVEWSIHSCPRNRLRCAHDGCDLSFADERQTYYHRLFCIHRPPAATTATQAPCRHVGCMYVANSIAGRNTHEATCPHPVLSQLPGVVNRILCERPATLSPGDQAALRGLLSLIATNQHFLIEHELDVQNMMQRFTDAQLQHEKDKAEYEQLRADHEASFENVHPSFAPAFAVEPPSPPELEVGLEQDVKKTCHLLLPLLLPAFDHMDKYVFSVEFCKDAADNQHSNDESDHISDETLQSSASLTSLQKETGQAFEDLLQEVSALCTSIQQTLTSNPNSDNYLRCSRQWRLVVARIQAIAQALVDGATSVRTIPPVSDTTAPPTADTDADGDVAMNDAPQHPQQDAITAGTPGDPDGGSDDESDSESDDEDAEGNEDEDGDEGNEDEDGDEGDEPSQPPTDGNIFDLDDGHPYLQELILQMCKTSSTSPSNAGPPPPLVQSDLNKKLMRLAKQWGSKPLSYQPGKRKQTVSSPDPSFEFESIGQGGQHVLVSGDHLRDYFFRAYNVLGDGNCLLRAFALGYYRSEEYHMTVRSDLQEHIRQAMGASKERDLSPHLMQHYVDINEHTAQDPDVDTLLDQIEKPYTWGTAELAEVLAICYGVEVLIFAATWSDEEMCLLVTLQAVRGYAGDKQIYLLHQGNHYKLLLPVGEGHIIDTDRLPISLRSPIPDYDNTGQFLQPQLDRQLFVTREPRVEISTSSTSRLQRIDNCPTEGSLEDNEDYDVTTAVNDVPVEEMLPRPPLALKYRHHQIGRWEWARIAELTGVTSIDEGVVSLAEIDRRWRYRFHLFGKARVVDTHIGGETTHENQPSLVLKHVSFQTIKFDDPESAPEIPKGAQILLEWPTEESDTPTYHGRLLLKGTNVSGDEICYEQPIELPPYHLETVHQQLNPLDQHDAWISIGRFSNLRPANVVQQHLASHQVVQGDLIREIVHAQDPQLQPRISQAIGRSTGIWANAVSATDAFPTQNGPQTIPEHLQLQHELNYLASLVPPPRVFCTVRSMAGFTVAPCLRDIRNQWPQLQIFIYFALRKRMADDIIFNRIPGVQTQAIQLVGPSQQNMYYNREAVSLSDLEQAESTQGAGPNLNPQALAFWQLLKLEYDARVPNIAPPQARIVFNRAHDRNGWN